MATKEQQAVNEEIDNVDKIRDILFGKQIKDIDQKFQTLHAQINESLDALRLDANKRFDLLESHVDAGISSLSERIVVEQGLRADGFDHAEKQLQAHAKIVFDQLASHKAEANQNNDIMQQQLAQKSEEIFDLIKLNHKQNSEALKQAMNKLDASKIDKSDLASLFSNLATQISDSNVTVK